MEEFRQLFKSVYCISDEELSLLYKKMTLREYKKGELILEEGALNKYNYFLLSGFAKAYIYQDGKEGITWFVDSCSFLTPILGVHAQKYSLVNIKAIEPTRVLIIKRVELEQLMSCSLELSNWVRHYNNKVLAELELFFSSDFFLNSTSQYERLLLKTPQLLQKVPLKDLASFLNITPESLSRIRAKIGKL